MKIHFFRVLSFLCSVCLTNGLIAATVIGLDLEALPGGAVSASDLANARTSDSASAAPFTLRAKTEPKAEVVVESDGRRALRLFAPSPSEDTLVSSLYLGFRDPRFAEFFSAETPVVIQTTLRAGTDQCAIALETIFVKDDVTRAHAVFRTRESKAGAQDQLLDLPAGEIVEVSVALSATGGGVQVTLKAESKGSLLEQREWVIPGEGWGLQDLVIVNLVLDRAGQQLDDSFVDVLAFKVSQ